MLVLVMVAVDPDVVGDQAGEGGDGSRFGGAEGGDEFGVGTGSKRPIQMRTTFSVSPGVGWSSVSVDEGSGRGGQSSGRVSRAVYAGGHPGTVHQKQQLVGELFGVAQTRGAAS
jgi:hypothetical protein